MTKRKSKHNRSASIHNDSDSMIGPIRSALDGGNYSLVRMYAGLLGKFEETSLLAAEAKELVRKIDIDPRVIALGFGVLMFMMIISLCVMS